jgi:transposase
MKKSRDSEERGAIALRQDKLDVGESSFYRWKMQYARMGQNPQAP